ncbi:MAG: hypothetical protein K8T90_07135 [Planctomycetes bacterium]|nr:hypothetical protein [Planctomycetota bacterium]
MPTHLLTVAESTDYTKTSVHADVMRFIEALAPLTDRMHVSSMGVSAEGREIPVLVFSDDKRFTPEAAHAAARTEGRPVVMLVCNIHAGEVEGKEAALMLARDMTTGSLARLMRGATVVVVPLYNPDGNDRIDVKHRALDLDRMDGQVGPEGVGTRYTGAGINLNRDYTKLEAVESRLLMACYGAWNPHVFVDSHTSDGSLHAYLLTFDTSHTVLSGPKDVILYTRDTMLPAIGKTLEARTGMRTWFYGNFRDNADPTSGWETYPGLPRYGSHYRGLTGRIDILLEAYSYAPFKDRVAVTYEIFVEILDYAAAHGRAIVDLCERAAADTIARGLDPQPDDTIGVNYGIATRNDAGELVFQYPAYALMDAEIASWDMDTLRARRITGGTVTKWKNVFYCRFVPEISVRRPRGYVVPASRTDVVDHLRAHNIEVERATRLAGNRRCEQYVVLAKETTFSPDVGNKPRVETVLWVHRESAESPVAAEDWIVPMDQLLAHVAIYLLEPQSDDGLVRWGWFDTLEPGDVYPVRRLPGSAGLAPPPRAKFE